MERIEKQLERIGQKDRLHQFVDELGDDEKVLILRQYADSDGDGATYQWRCFGDVSMAEALYMVESYRNWVFNG